MRRAAAFLSLLIIAAALAASAPRLGAATRVDLQGAWQFRVDAQREGYQNGWQNVPPADTETVQLPHTWGVGAHEDHLGTAWYFKSLNVPADVRTKRVELHVGAAFYRARVFVNGSEIGTHEGGYSSFFFDVTPFLRDENLIAIEVDNSPSRTTIPGWAERLAATGNTWYDWWPYGGLVRGAWIEVSERALIRRQEIRSALAAGTATVTARVFGEVFGGQGPLTLKARVLSPAGKLVAETQAPLGGAREVDATLTLRIPSPERWHFDAPNLYTLETRLIDRSGAALDVARERFGIRTLEIRDRALLLNGERVRLSGMTRHEDSPWEGLAETAGTIRRDWDELKALQVTLTRPVHYPQHPDVLDYADRNGVLLIPEIPVWQFSAGQLGDPAVVALAKRLVKEMIEEAGNHPSVMAWSVCNESATATPAGRAYVKTLTEYLRAIDPGRFVTFADDSLPRIKDGSESASQYADFVMVNQYFGSWAGPAEQLGPALDRIGAFYPDKMFIISEFGLAGFFEPDARRGDEHRIRIMRDQLREFARRDWIAGAIFWCYQDYKSHRNLWPGLVKGYVDMGVVDEHRQRKPSYDAWREETAPARVRVNWVRDSADRPIGFRATVERRSAGEIPSYDLRGYAAVWEVRKPDGSLVAESQTALPTIGAPASVEGSWAASSSPGLELRFRVLRPTGFEAAAIRINSSSPAPAGSEGRTTTTVGGGEWR
jgi:beta-glucuronidase